MDKLQGLLKDLINDDDMRAEKAVSQLVQMGEDAIPALLELSKSSNTDSRWWAIRTLAQSPHCRAEWLIPVLLTDTASEVRQCAALGLGNIVGEEKIPSLVAALSDEDTMVCNLAMNALVGAGSAAIPSLIEVVKGDQQSARIHALRALAEIKDHRAIPVMMKVMGEDSALLQHWAKEGLDRLGLDMVYIKSV